MSLMESPQGGWPEYQRLVLNQLERHNAWLERQEARLNKLEVEIGMLQVKAGLWGAVAGVIAVLGILLVQYIKKP